MNINNEFFKGFGAWFGEGAKHCEAKWETHGGHLKDLETTGLLVITDKTPRQSKFPPKARICDLSWVEECLKENRRIKLTAEYERTFSDPKTQNPVSLDSQDSVVIMGSQEPANANFATSTPKSMHPHQPELDIPDLSISDASVLGSATPAATGHTTPAIAEHATHDTTTSGKGLSLPDGHPSDSIYSADKAPTFAEANSSNAEDRSDQLATGKPTQTHDVTERTAQELPSVSDSGGGPVDHDKDDLSPVLPRETPATSKLVDDNPSVVRNGRAHAENATASSRPSSPITVSSTSPSSSYAGSLPESILAQKRFGSLSESSPRKKRYLPNTVQRTARSPPAVRDTDVSNPIFGSQEYEEVDQRTIMEIRSQPVGGNVALSRKERVGTELLSGRNVSYTLLTHKQLVHASKSSSAPDHARMKAEQYLEHASKDANQETQLRIIDIDSTNIAIHPRRRKHLSS